MKFVTMLHEEERSIVAAFRGHWIIKKAVRVRKAYGG
jgi:hypothetical protein